MSAFALEEKSPPSSARSASESLPPPAPAASRAKVHLCAFCKKRPRAAHDRKLCDPCVPVILAAVSEPACACGQADCAVCWLQAIETRKAKPRAPLTAREARCCIECKNWQGQPSDDRARCNLSPHGMPIISGRYASCPNFTQR